MSNFVPGVPVRRVDAYYEEGGPFGIDEGFARSIYGATLGVLSRHAGTIVLNGLRGVTLPLNNEALYLEEFNPAGEHIAMLTRRTTKRAGAGSITMDGTSLSTINSETKEVVSSKFLVHVLPAVQDPTGAITIGTATHEMAHTFDLGHCETPDCIMQSKTQEVRGFDARFLRGAPFCGDCAVQLEIAGRRALAHEIG